MQRVQTIRKNGSFGLSAAATLLLALGCAPALAATTNDANEDPGNERAVSFDVPVDEVSIPEAPAPSSISSKPRVESILRSIFDESAPAGQESAEATPAESSSDSSLAELALPGLLKEAADMTGVDDADEVESEESPPAVSTRLPGISDDLSLRYRRQMFRTDI